MDKREQLTIGARDLYNKMALLNGFMMKDHRFEDYKSSEIHCIETIGKSADSNVTKLAHSCYMTRGAISKLTKKLINKGAIESYQKADNKKEVYFRLTTRGQALYDLHEALHNEFKERDKPVFEQVTQEQFDVMLRFVQAYGQHLDVEIAKLGIDI